MKIVEEEQESENDDDRNEEQGASGTKSDFEMRLAL